MRPIRRTPTGASRPARQAAYLNQAQYLAWQDPRVGSLAQFLLVDSGPDRSYPRGSPGYWSTFQTGLAYHDGVHKPSFDAYRLPIFVPVPVVRPGTKTLVWGMLRAAPQRHHAAGSDPVAADPRPVPCAHDGEHQRPERLHQRAREPAGRGLGADRVDSSGGPGVLQPERCDSQRVSRCGEPLWVGRCG